MHRLCSTTLILLLTLCSPLPFRLSTATAQATGGLVLAPPAAGKVQRLTLRDGSEVVGRIISVDATSIRFESSLGIASIPISSIVSIAEVNPATLGDGRFAFRNPNATRLIFAPTGRMLAKGEGYFSDFYIFFPGVNVGLTDRVSVGGMMSVFPGAGLDEQVYFFTPKVGLVQNANTNIAAGALVLGWPGGDSDEGFSAGIAYGVGTFGSENLSLTVGAGYGFVDGRLENSPFMMLGGESRVSSRVAVVTENWVMPGGKHGIASGGVRFLGRGMAVDFGLAHPIGSGTGGAGVFPLLGFVWKW
jgi:hypothetical protein